MKYKYMFLILACLTLTYALTTMGYMQTTEKEGIEVTIISSREVYSAGEVIPLNLIIKNTGVKEITIGGELTFAEIYVSQDGKNFRECTNTSRTREDAKQTPIRLFQNGSIENFETILWNSDKTSNDSVRPWKVGRVLTDYAFPKAGDYYVKAGYIIYLSAKPILIESKPIKITITEPEGESLEVWNKIKDRGDFAYFIQYGEFLAPLYKTEERAKFQAEVEEILTQYPNSFYAEPLRQSLEKFKASEAKRKAMIEKLKVNSTPNP